MRVVHRTATGEEEVVLDVGDPHATAADLAEALAGPDAGTAAVSIDGRVVDPDATLLRVGLRQGSVVEVGGSPRIGRRRSEPSVELHVIGGAAVGSFAGPVGAVVGGLIGGAIGAGIGGKVKDWLFDLNPGEVFGP